VYKRASLMQPIRNLFRTKEPAIWPHLFPLNSMSHQYSLRGGQSVNIIQPEIIEDILRRRFRRGSRQCCDPNVFLSDCRTIDAFRESCESFAREPNIDLRDRRPQSLLIVGSVNHAMQILNELYELANVLTISEISKILKESVFENESLSDETLVNLLNSYLNYSRITARS
jgi:hypothetical protein